MFFARWQIKSMVGIYGFFELHLEPCFGTKSGHTSFRSLASQEISPLVSDPATVLLISFPSPSQVSAHHGQRLRPHMTAFSSVWKPRGIAGWQELLDSPWELVQKEESRSKGEVCVARLHTGIHKPVLSCSSCSCSCYQVSAETIWFYSWERLFVQSQTVEA